MASVWALPAEACRLAQDLYRDDAHASGRVLPDWHALDMPTRQGYVEKAAKALAAQKVVPFIRPVETPPQDRAPHAVRDIETGICDLINAVNAARTEGDVVELTDAIRSLRVQLDAASEVAWHREQQFFPKGA